MLNKKAVLIADPFSLGDNTFKGRMIANRALLRSLFLCDEVHYVIAVGGIRGFEDLNLHEVVEKKLVLLDELHNLRNTFEHYDVCAIICSDFGGRYANWIAYRNLNHLSCAVVSFTHTLSMQGDMADIIRFLCAQPSSEDTIFCTSDAAVTVMQRLLSNAMSVLSIEAKEPNLVKFPLPYTVDTHFGSNGRKSDTFQILYVGRLDWRDKADLLVLPAMIKRMKHADRVRLVVAGNAQDKGYVDLLGKVFEQSGIELLTNITDAEKYSLYKNSHVFISFPDNYQETFGLTVLEAKYFGCVPVVSDFDGYRDLIKDGADGILLPCVGAPIPESLWNTQPIVSDIMYHGWWASGVSIDPLQAARAIDELVADRNYWRKLSAAAEISAIMYSEKACSERFSDFFARLNPGISEQETEGYQLSHNIFHWNYCDIFGDHPSTTWNKKKIKLTADGEQFIEKPQLVCVPQVQLLTGFYGVNDILSMLVSVADGATCDELLVKGFEPIGLSIALKNGLIEVV